MLQALLRTTTEILDSKKAAYSFIATSIAVVLHVKFGVSAENALVLVSPLALATAAQAHVDAKRSTNGSTDEPLVKPPPGSTSDDAASSPSGGPAITSIQEGTPPGNNAQG